LITLLKRIPLVFSQAMLRKTDTPSVRMKTRTKKNNSKANSISLMEMMTCSAFGFFAGPTICYSTGMIIASLAQLVNLLDIHLTAFGVQVLPIMTTEKVLYLMFSCSMAVPWGLATLGVLFGSQLLLVPIQICKIRSYQVAVGIALAQSGEDNFRGCVLLAVMEAIQLAFIWLVFITMACGSHRPLIYTITNIGKQEISKREVKINIVHSAREGVVAGINKEEDEGEGVVSQEEKVTSEDIKVALPRKEEELKVKMAAESNGIYPVLQPSDSPV